jgi:hypothetical protein
MAAMNTETPTPGNGPRPFLDLSGLLDTLHGLYLQISGLLLHRRLHPPPADGPVRDIDIASQMDARLAQVATLAHEQKTEQGQSQPVDSPATRATLESPSQPTPGLTETQEGLQAPGGRRGAVAASQPQLGEKMQAATWEHINKAQLFARQGKLESARLHAGLAQNAMETASRYMGDEEYAAFKTDVDARVHAIDADSSRQEAG